MYSRSSGEDEEILKEVLKDCRDRFSRIDGNCVLGVKVQTEDCGKKAQVDRLLLVVTGDLFVVQKRKGAASDRETEDSSGPPNGKQIWPLERSSAVHVIGLKRSSNYFRAAASDFLEGIGGGMSTIV
jgi:hypothetical protein